jgi:hypothetical protein
MVATFVHCTNALLQHSMQQVLPQVSQHWCVVSRSYNLVHSAACRLLLGCECCYLTDVVKPRLEVLTAGLPGADIAAMVQEDPRLLFEELESSESGPSAETLFTHVT